MFPVPELVRSLEQEAACSVQYFQNTPDVVPIQMRQEMPHDKGQAVRAKTSRTPKLTNNGALFLRGFLGQVPGTAAAVLAGI